MSIPMLDGRSTIRRRRGGLFALTAAVALTLPSAAFAQATGTVTGRVVDGRSGAPIEAAQVFIPGLSLGALSAANGRFLITSVPAGTHQLRAERLGYTAFTQQVTVTAGQAASVDIRLEQQAIGLDEIVVTGEAGAARQREVGNAIASVKLQNLVEPPRDVQQLLGGRIAGAVITESTGAAGSGGFVRLRGISSVSMSNTPLLYVDGIRVRSEDLPTNYPRGDRSNRSGNVQASPLSQINPEDIDRIEVIKGAAATSIYGTEASAGVIQIFTKKGQQQGKAQWQFTGTQTMRKTLPFGGNEHLDWIDSDGVVMGNSDYMYTEPWLRNALGQELSASVRGGFQNTSYFLSVDGTDQDYAMPNDFEKRVSVRGNLGFQVMPGLSMEWNTAFSKAHIKNTPSGDNAQGIELNAQRPTTSYTGAVPTLRGNISRLLEFDIDTYPDRFTTGLTFRHNVTKNVDHRFTIGYDRTYIDYRSVRPFGFILDPTGIVDDKRWTGEILTMDYAANATVPVASKWALTFSAGGQAVQNEESSSEGTGLNLPGPSQPVVNSGAITVAFEDRSRVINAGFFGQVRIGWRDRLFLTLGGRVDGNSAFGKDFGLQKYPKISASYVLSDESFWPDSWGTMKLRAAYGQAGKAPGAFDATRTWNPSKYVGTSAFVPKNLGDPGLGPERTAEAEVGFTAGFLKERLTIDYTYFRHHTEDALFNVRAAPSMGGRLWDPQRKNVGELKNSGMELTLDGTMVERPNFGWDLGLIVYTNKSEVVSLGGAPAFSVGGNGWIMEGQPVAVLVADYVTNPDEKADPKIVSDHIYGPSQPTHTITPSTTLRLPKGITVSARGEYLGGNFITDANMYGEISRGEIGYAGCRGFNTKDKNGQLGELTAMQRWRCLQRFATKGKSTGPVNRGDFFKMRDISVRLPLTFWSAVQSPSLTLSARNAVRWFNSDWWSYEPEVGCNGTGCLVISQQEHVPPPATFTASLRFGL